MGKKPKLPSIKALKTKAENLWKECCLIRDGRECMVRKYYPWIKISHTEVIQVDHCFTRGNKMTFLNVANGTVVCSGCNSAKHWQNKSVHRAIDEIVKTREGLEVFNEMYEIDAGHCANSDFSKRWFLEQEIARLEQVKEGLIFSGTHPQK